MCYYISDGAKGILKCEMKICPAILVRNGTAISDFCSPDVNEGFLLRNLYVGQEATVRTGHGTTNWFQIGKGVHQGCILSPSLFNLYRVHLEKRWAGGSTSWHQDCWEKYQ